MLSVLLWVALYSFIYRVAPKKLTHFVLYALTSSNIDRFSNLFHCQSQENICNNTVIKDPTTPQVCHYTTLWNVSVLKSNNWKQDNFCNTWRAQSRCGARAQRRAGRGAHEKSAPRAMRSRRTL